MTSPTHGHFDQEKRVRREIANSNERRRMQSINAGFDSLRILLPTISDGEKMSKATILQLTAKYINTLLMRVSLLESEVAVYRQSAGLQPNAITTDMSCPILTARKRKSDDLKKRPDCIRSRRRRVETDGTFDSTRQNYIHFSPESTDTHQSSPLNSFNSSTSICSASPQPESTSSTAARLEHLVMAIEQIEGVELLTFHHNLRAMMVVSQWEIVHHQKHTGIVHKKIIMVMHMLTLKHQFRNQIISSQIPFY
ncbi:unnamed protein product [Heterobilharzia americana]|nr:unnamed protein product [Heterobilharzia americana]